MVTNKEIQTNMRKEVERATRAIIDLGAISYNVAEIRKRIGAKRDLMAVVKADGYGHGAVEVARTALRSGANCLAVAIPEEGEQLRKAGIDVPILVLGLIQPEEAYKVVGARLEQAICSLELAEALDQEARQASFQINTHVKVDTGMGRMGLSPREAYAFVGRVKRFRNLKVIGIFSHFSSADERDKSFSKKQAAIFDELIREFDSTGFHIPKKHIANSAAILDLPESYYDLVRPGIMLYGLYPSGEVSKTIRLKPAMNFLTRVACIKMVPTGTPIGYGRTFTTSKPTKLAVLPLGYADGYSRLLSNRGEVLIRGVRSPVVGRVCMDTCMVDVSALENVRTGDDVVLFGDSIPVEEIAGKIGTINYEVVCSIGKRVPRIYING